MLIEEKAPALGVAEGLQEKHNEGGEPVTPIIASDSKSPLDFALQYAKNGYEILPVFEIGSDGNCSCTKGAACQFAGKHPRTAHGVKEATNGLDQIREWWKRWPAANIGMVPQGFSVVDVDPRNGGDATPFDQRCHAQSGGGGNHFIFKPVMDAASAKGFLPGLDFNPGYFLVEPSNHKSRGTYRWLDASNPLTCDLVTLYNALPELPEWIGEALEAAEVKALEGWKKFKPAAAGGVAEGGRDHYVTAFAASYYVRSKTEPAFDTLVKALRKENARVCVPPLDDSDIVYKARRAASSSRLKEWRASSIERRATNGDGLVQVIEAAIKENSYFARDEGDLLYVFQDGAYQPNGKRFAKDATIVQLEKIGKQHKWSPELASKIVEYITRKAPLLWDRPPLDALNCTNGLLDVATRRLRPHSPDFLSPIQIGAAYDPDARCPAIDKFVADTFPGDAQHIAYELAAWLMLPITSIQKAALLFGEGSNGKSIYLSMLEDFLGGKKNIASVPLHKLEADKFACARLVGKLANINADLPERALSGSSIFKALTGNDLVNAERKFEGSFEFRPYARLLFSANTLPRSDDASHGFFRRWEVIPFNRKFNPEEPGFVKPEVLRARLHDELSGLLNAALDKLPAVTQGDFTSAPSLREASSEFRNTTDPLSVWLDANTVLRPGAYVSKDRVRSAYARYCQENDKPILMSEVFTKRLRALRPEVDVGKRRVDGEHVPCFNGIGWRSNQNVPPESGVEPSDARLF